MVERLLALEWWNYRMLDAPQGLDFSDVETSIGTIKDLIGHGKLGRLMPHHMVRTIYGLGNINFP